MRQYPLIVATSVLLLGGLAWSLATLEIDRSANDAAGAANLLSLWPWWLVSAALWAVLTLLYIKLGRSKIAVGRHRIDIALILGVAVFVRLIVVITHNPTLSDDIHRYTFDGRNLAAGMNPYLVKPADRLDVDTPRWPGESETAALINNPELHTIYLPVSQYVFAGAAMIVGEQWSDPLDAARIYRAVFGAVDIVVIILLLVALQRTRRSPWWAVLYAWHPLAITEFAGSGHQDVIGIALMLGALLVVTPVPGKIRRQWWCFPVALAILVKPIAVVAGLFIIRRCRWRGVLVAGVLGSAALTATAAPLLFTHGGQPISNLRGTAERFTMKWSHFGSVYEPTLAALNVVDPIEDREIQWQKKERHEAIARWFGLFAIAAIVLLIFARGIEPWTAARIVLLAMVLVSPTAHAWYVLWALALMPMSPSPALWVLSITLPWGYAVLGDTVDWKTPGWVYLAAYLPVYMAIGFEFWAALRRGGHQNCTVMKSADSAATIEP